MCPIPEKYWLYSSVGKDAWELMTATHSHLWIVLSPTCRSDHSHPRWWRGVWPIDFVDHLSHNTEISLPNKLQIMNQNSFHVISLSKKFNKTPPWCSKLIGAFIPPTFTWKMQEEEKWFRSTFVHQFYTIPPTQLFSKQRFLKCCS